MKKYSSSLAAAAVGVVVLAVMAVFAIVLPKTGDDATPESGATSALPRLPQKIGDLVALDSDQVPAALQQQVGGASQITRAQDEGGRGLEKVYGASAAYKIYATPDGRSLAAVMVLDREPGLFSPDGPPVTGSDQQPAYQLSRVQGAVCAEYYGQQQSATGQPGGAVQLTRAHCQLGADGRTYDIDARGVSVAKTVTALKELADA